MTRNGTETREGQDRETGLGAKHDGPVGEADAPNTQGSISNPPTSFPTLLPCPFCGSADHLFIEPEETGSGGQWVSPIHAGCDQIKGCGVSRIGDDTAEAIEAWNTRPQLQSTEAVERRQWAPDEPSPKPLACYDCGLPYESDAWVEAVVSHEIWNEYLSPRGNSGGILCINCMAARAIAKGLRDIPCELLAGPFIATTALTSPAVVEDPAIRICKRCGTPEGEPHRYRHIPEYVEAAALLVERYREALTEIEHAEHVEIARRIARTVLNTPANKEGL